jgi:hypothetical protein
MMIPAKVLRKRKKKNTNKSGSDLSFYAQAFQIIKGRKSLADVAIELDIKTDVVLDFYRDYLILIKMNCYHQKWKIPL